MYQRISNIVVTDLDDEVVLLNPSNQQMFTLNETGRELWLQLAQPASLSQLTEHITSIYDVSAEEAAQDVKMIVDSLLEHALIEPCSQ